MKRELFYLSCVATVSSLWAATPVIDSVVMTQSPSREVSITYSLSGEDAIVTAEVFHDDESIGLDKVSNMTGDVNRLVATGSDRLIKWRPTKTWPNQLFTDGSVKVKLTAWTKSCPPPYLAVNLETPNTVRYYADERAVPGGIQDRAYKTTWLLLKKIDAAGRMSRLGANPKEYGGDESSGRLMTFTQDFYAAVFETTVAQHYAITGVRPSAATTAPEVETTPVNKVSYETLRGKVGDSPSVNWPTTDRAVVSATSVLGVLRARTGLPLDLPTQAQWEYAARAGASTLYQAGAYTSSAGDNEKTIDKMSWFGADVYISSGKWWDGNCDRLHSVGEKSPNAFGLYDMVGNIQEWCLDWATDYASMPRDAQDYPGPSAGDDGKRTLCGSCWKWNASTCKLNWRQSYTPGTADLSAGYRLYLTLD